MNISHFISVAFCTAAALCPAHAEEVMTVKSGDTLIGIAKQILGDQDRWQEICEINSAELNGNCNLIRPGQNLKIPLVNEDITTSAEDLPPSSAPALQSGAVSAVQLTPKKPSDVTGAVIFGPANLSDHSWDVGGDGVALDTTTGFIRSSGDLLRAGIYDPNSARWIVGPENYAPSADGFFSVSFKAPVNGYAVRIYPLRGTNDESWAYLVVDGLIPGEEYRANWTVERNDDQYRIINLEVWSS